MKFYYNKSTIVHEDSDIFKLTIAVHKAVEGFMINKPTKPTRLFFNDRDFNLQGGVEVLGYKVRFTNLVPSGQVIVMDDTPFTIFDKY